MDEWMDRWMNGCMDGWMNGWMDTRKCVLVRTDAMYRFHIQMHTCCMIYIQFPYTHIPSSCGDCVPIKIIIVVMTMCRMCNAMLKQQQM